MKKTIHSRPPADKQKGTVRIIGGQYRGKILHFSPTDGLRPTPNRIRETVFNWLMHDIQNARCLDLFAGSGALGFEAFSRGATHVTLIEKSPEAYRNLNHIMTRFHSQKLRVIHTSALHYLHEQAQGKEQYDIVFIDPPFDHPELFDCIETFAQSNVLRDEGLLYVESPQNRMLNPSVWKPLKCKKTGQVTYALYQKRSLTSRDSPVPINISSMDLEAL